MSPAGDAELLVAARTALLDALDALAGHREALVLIGAQAIYLHTGAAIVALAETTKDSDLAIDPRVLANAPLLDDAMAAAGFHRDLVHPQPGGWLTAEGIPVDLMVPEALAGSGSGRGARIPPHHKHATRRTVGLEAAIVDHAPMAIEALADGDQRATSVKVAGPAALLVAKLHKLGERQGSPNRLLDKDAHDIYRLLVAIETEALRDQLAMLLADDLAGPNTQQAVAYMATLFARADAPGAAMAGRAEQLVGDPEVVSAAAAALAEDLVSALGADDHRGAQGR